MSSDEEQHRNEFSVSQQEDEFQVIEEVENEFNSHLFSINAHPENSNDPPQDITDNNLNNTYLDNTQQPLRFS